MASFHTSAAQRARVLMSRLRDILMFLRSHFFRAGGREPFWRAGVALLFPHPPARGEERSQRGRLLSLSKGVGCAGFLQECGARYHLLGQKMSDTRTTSCSECAHVLCVRAVHSQQVEQMVSMWKKLMKHVGIGEPTSWLDHVSLNVNANRINHH